LAGASPNVRSTLSLFSMSNTARSQPIIILALRPRLVSKNFKISHHIECLDICMEH
jgi:hypothetical protein